MLRTTWNMALTLIACCLSLSASRTTCGAAGEVTRPGGAAADGGRNECWWVCWCWCMCWCIWVSWRRYGGGPTDMLGLWDARKRLLSSCRSSSCWCCACCCCCCGVGGCWGLVGGADGCGCGPLSAGRTNWHKFVSSTSQLWLACLFVKTYHIGIILCSILPFKWIMNQSNGLWDDNCLRYTFHIYFEGKYIHKGSLK